MRSTLCLCFICCLLLSRFLFAQSRLSDSLQSALERPHVTGKEKAELLIRLAEIYRVDKNFKLATEKARQSATVALSHKNYTEATKAYTMLLNIKTSTQQFKTLKSTADSALFFAEKSGNPAAMASAYYAQALLYKALDNADDVVKYCNLGLKQLEKSPDPYIAAKIYYRLYAVHSAWNDQPKVNEYARMATENALKAKDYNLLSNCYTAMSVAKSNPDSILLYLKKSELLYQQYPGQVADYTYAIACINLSSAYLKYFPPTDLLAEKQGIYYATQARAVLKNTENSQEVIASSLGILSEYAKRDGHLAQAESYLLAAYKVMQGQQTPYYHTMINVTQALADFYGQQQDYKKAAHFQKEVNQYSQKNFNQEQATTAQKLEIQYETERKNNEVRILKEKEKNRRIQNYLYGCIAIASLLGLLFMFRSYHFKLRYSLQREKQLQLEKQDSELQLKLEQEEQARLKAEQLLLAAQQEQLKKEAMANALQLDHKNQMLHSIKNKLSDGAPVNMHKILKEEMILDSDFEQAKLQIQQVHPDFFHLINGQAQKKLSPLDLKLCAYLYLKMDTRQIAQLMHIEAKSVRMSRYRIKQKLGLEKQDDLNTFLQRLGNS